MKSKLYPFSARKHARDIEFARDKTFCVLHSLQMDDHEDNIRNEAK